MALNPLATLSGVSILLVICLAPFAESSKMLMSLIEIWCPLAISLSGASFGSCLTETPIAGRKYVVSTRSFKFLPSLTVLFCVCGILQELFPR